MSLQVDPGASILVVGEVLWDLYEDSRCLGGAPLNFAVHAHRLSHPVTLISAVGADELGEQALERIAALDLNTSSIQITQRFPTGTAQVLRGENGGSAFSIPRPAAYDALEISAADLDKLQTIAPAWLYYGTLFASRSRPLLDRLLAALPQTLKFYDLNLRPGSEDPELVEHLLRQADVVKLNEDELRRVSQFTGLSSNRESFCREGSRRFGWQAVAVTLAERGCAVLSHGGYVEVAASPTEVVDPIGAGDAFAAAFLHGLSRGRQPSDLAVCANRLAAHAVTHRGAISAQTAVEAMKL